MPAQRVGRQAACRYDRRVSDRQLRELERAFAASGDPADEARLLAHRVRAGLLHPAWLETAARLGHEPARRVLGRFVPLLDERALVEALPLLGRRAAVLGLVTQARACLPAWDDLRPGDDRPQRALDLLAGWARGAPDVEPPPEAAELARASWEQLTGGGAGLGAYSVSVVEAAGRVRSAADVARGPEAGWEKLAAWEIFGSFPDTTREVRATLVPYALGPPRGVPPPTWPEPVAGTLDREALRAAEQAFDEALAAKETRRRATPLRRRLREKTLARPLLEVAADLGDPAAWLVARRPGRPDLMPVETVEELARRLEVLVERRSAAPHGPSQRRPAARRQAPWVPTLTVRAALALAEEAASRLADPARAAPYLEALRGWLRAPDVEVARPRRSRAAADDPTLRLLAAACDLAVKSDATSAPRLHHDAPRASLLREAEQAGLDAPAQWALLRRTLAAWALGEDVLGPDARPYAPAERWAEGERMRHPRFGEGRVARVLGDKVEVDFGGEVRTLVHGHASRRGR